MDYFRQRPWLITVIFLNIGSVFAALIYTMLIPFLPMYLMDELGVGMESVKLWSGLCFAASFLFAGIMAPIWGAMADRYSQKVMVVRAALFLGVTYFLGGLVHSGWELFFVRCLQGFASGFIPASMAIVSAMVPRKELGLHMGIMQSAITAGSILGPFLGGVIAEWTGMRVSFFIGGGTLMAMGLLYIFIVPELPKPEPKPEPVGGEEKNLNWTLLKAPLVFPLLVTSAVLQLAIYCVQPILPLYLGDLRGSMDQIGLVTGTVFSVVGIAGLISAPLWGALGGRWSYRDVLYVSLFTSGLFCLLQVIPDSVEGFTAWRFVAGFCAAGISPASMALLSTYTDPAHRGRIFGFNFAAQQAGGFLGPLMGGIVASFFPLGAVLLLSGVVFILNALYLMAVWPKDLKDFKADTERHLSSTSSDSR